MSVKPAAAHRALLHQIARGEGVDDDRARSHGFASGYDVPFNYGRFAQQTKPLTQMTLGEIDALQVRMASHPENPGRSTPVGRYQFTRATLRELRSELELDDRGGLAKLHIGISGFSA